jgi:tetratricopeptide (TPR) repeat protein
MLFAATLAAVSVTASVELPVSTGNHQAQAAIDRGLFDYYAYDGDDAARAFNEATALDPQLAMAYWGEALAAGPDLNTPITQNRYERAAAAIGKAVAREENASALERRFVAAMALRYQGPFTNWKAHDAAYRRAMVVLAQGTHNENAELLAAEALLEGGGLTWNGGMLANDDSREALELVAGVLRADPSNVMANHLCIHLYDLAPDRSPALPCAQRLDAVTFPPEGEHLAHMPAHYWIETGNYTAAIASSERAYALLTQLPNGGIDSAHGQQYAKHDVAVGYSAAMMLGSYATAQRWGERMETVFGTSFAALTALRFGRYETAYDVTTPQIGDAAVRGLAALRLGKLSEAQALAKRIPASAFQQGYLPQIFEAELAAANGNEALAEQWLDRSAANQRAAFSGELIPWIPAGEVLGSLRLRRGDAPGAIAAFTDTLAAYPNDPRAIYGLAQALATNGDLAKAAVAQAQFQKEWEGADTTLGGALP